MSGESGLWRHQWLIPATIWEMHKEEVLFRVARLMNISQEQLYSDDKTVRSASRISVYEHGVIEVFRNLSDEEIRELLRKGTR